MKVLLVLSLSLSQLSFTCLSCCHDFVGMSIIIVFSFSLFVFWFFYLFSIVMDLHVKLLQKKITALRMFFFLDWESFCRGYCVFLSWSRTYLSLIHLVPLLFFLVLFLSSNALFCFLLNKWKIICLVWVPIILVLILCYVICLFCFAAHKL